MVKKTVRLMVLLMFVSMLSSMTAYAEADLGSWTTKASISTDKYGVGTVGVNGKIYVIGGHGLGGLGGNFNTVEEYNAVTNQWTIKSNMPTPRSALSVVEVNGKIYAIGGQSDKYTNVVEEYNPITDQWTKKTSMQFARNGLGLAAVNGKIYAIGGHDGNGYVKEIEEYDPLTNTWKIVTTIPTTRAHLGVAVANEKIYVIGGSEDSTIFNVVEEYDPVTKIWTTKASMPTSRYGLGVTEVKGKLYAIGGTNNGTYNTVEEYDPITDSWKTMTSMPTPRRYLGVAQLNGKVYAIGGTDNNHRFNTVEEYTPPAPEPTFILDIEPQQEKINLFHTVTADLVIDNITDIVAEDIRIQYDQDKLEFLGFEEVAGMKLVQSIEDTGKGQLRVIIASMGETNIIHGKEVLLQLKFKGIGEGEAVIDITKGRVTDGITIEKDLLAEACGKGSITIEALKDVDNSGAFTLLDLGIDARHLTKDPTIPELEMYHTDIVENGVIDEADLLAIAQYILDNPNYTPNNE
ncbi:hypothetical protein HZI73_10325 [Vallitalea pronyensis]|uniref:Cohesin domain-containing protein n=1 Tax=Vallitalea pronyensis TaxID=1348613 RepID=A0A8J8MJE0_9FIRM|nr:kelch repeat-containing protein [Vallitalea pronyensis]QUI22669.1 hypothetical protein HZI73_10325 [Vallitalea pronyensis]